MASAIKRRASQVSPISSSDITMEYFTIKQKEGGTKPMVVGQYVPFIENEIIEFKMHTNFTTEELPDWIFDGPPPPRNKQEKEKQEIFNGKYSRKPVSRNFNAFLNSGKGGIVYIGIQDDGRIIGLNLSLDQREHLRVSLEDVMFRYTPPVPTNLYQISFIPVLKKTNSKRSIITSSWKPTMTSKAHQENYCCQPHLVRTSKSCWCNQMSSKERRALPLYIVQVSIMPLPVNQSTIVQPLYLDEENKCYFRRSASVWQCTYSELIRRTTEQVAEYYLSKSSYCEERSLSLSPSQ